MSQTSKNSSKHKINALKLVRISHHITWKQKTGISYFKPIFDFMGSIRHKKLRAKRMMMKKYKCTSKCKCQEKINNFVEVKKTKEYKSKLSALTDQQISYIDKITEKLNQVIHGEEFSVPEKLMCLSIYNTSEIIYNYLSSLIPLPNFENLKKFRKSIPFDTGVTSAMLNRLTEVSNTMRNINKNVVLMLGSIDIEPRLYYNGKLDKILGFEDWGNYYRDVIADKSYIFAIRGIESDWFLPVAYIFSDEMPKISKLVKLFKNVVKCVKFAGFHIVATVCDNEEWYVGLLEKLRIHTLNKRGPDTENNYGTILVHGIEIVPLFNPINLLIDFRNNLVSQDLEFFINLMERPMKWDHERERRIFENMKKPLIASWKHIQAAFGNNNNETNSKIPSLSRTSVCEEELTKSDFNYVLEIFNEKVAASLDKLSSENQHSIDGDRIPSEGFFTSFILNFLDKLCDALTGGNTKDDPKYELKTLLTNGSFHHEFFEVAKIHLQHMRFVDRETQEPIAPVSCLEKLIITIIGFQVLWKKLQEHDFHFVKMRNFNLELLDGFLMKHKLATCAKFARDFKNHCYLDISI